MENKGFNQKDIINLHKRGLLPDRYYYQLIDQIAEINLQEQHERFYNELYEKSYDEQVSKAIGAISKEIIIDLFKS